MKNLFEPGNVTEIRERLQQLRVDSPRQWGTMTPAQAVAHCANALEAPIGDRRPPRMLLGILMGRAIKRLALGNDAPMRKNSPTVPGFQVADKRDLTAERQRLLVLIDRFVAAGRGGMTTHPHSFFGRLTPEEWGVLSYKHLDHHLRQFGV
jgi:hypothetical protein